MPGDGSFELIEPRLHRLPQLIGIVDLGGVIAGQFDQFVDIGMNIGFCGQVLVEKTLFFGEQVAARRTFSRADAQEQR